MRTRETKPADAKATLPEVVMSPRCLVPESHIWRVKRIWWKVGNIRHSREGSGARNQRKVLVGRQILKQMWKITETSEVWPRLGFYAPSNTRAYYCIHLLFSLRLLTRLILGSDAAIFSFFSVLHSTFNRHSVCMYILYKYITGVYGIRSNLLRSTALHRRR